jgi:hypothetical protein
MAVDGVGASVWGVSVLTRFTYDLESMLEIDSNGTLLENTGSAATPPALEGADRLDFCQTSE